MTWIRCQTATGPQLGVLSANAVDGVTGSEGTVPVHLLDGTRSLVDLLAQGELATAAAQARARAAVPVAVERLLAPIADPPSIRDFMAFEQHVEGVGRLVGSGVPDVWYEQPLYYFTNPAAVLGPYEDVPVPPGCEVLDFELEVAAVIGRGCADATLAEAEAAIAGYLVLNDWSARDLQFAEMRGPLGPCKGKDSAMTFGPLFVPADELPDLSLAMRAWVNDELIGEDRLDRMAWTFPELVAYASRGTRLRPGDVLGSGTCGGGCLAELWGRRGRDSRPPLRAGDVVRLSVDRLGETRSRIVAGSPIRQPLARRVPGASAAGSPVAADGYRTRSNRAGGTS